MTSFLHTSEWKAMWKTKITKKKKKKKNIFVTPFDIFFGWFYFSSVFKKTRKYLLFFWEIFEKLLGLFYWKCSVEVVWLCAQTKWPQMRTKTKNYCKYNFRAGPEKPWKFRVWLENFWKFRKFRNCWLFSSKCALLKFTNAFKNTKGATFVGICHEIGETEGNTLKV